MSSMAIRTEALSKRYGNVDALVRLDLEVDQVRSSVTLDPTAPARPRPSDYCSGSSDRRMGAARSSGSTVNPAGGGQPPFGLRPGEANRWPSLTGAETLHLLGRLQGQVDPDYRDE